MTFDNLSASISAAEWSKGIALSVLASLIGGASKLSIRKSWLLEEEYMDFDEEPDEAENDSDRESPPPESAMTLDTDSVSSSEENYPVTTVRDGINQQRRWPRWTIPVARYGGMFGMSVLNPICCVLAMNYASPSILAPFSGLTMVWVILFSQPVVGERPSQAQVFASFLIIVGEVIVAVFGDHTNDVNVSVETVKNSYKNPLFLLYFAALAFYLTLLAYWICFSDSPVLRRFAWGSCGGSMTGQQNFLKDALTLFKAPGGLRTWTLPFFVFMAAATAFSGLLILTSCMKRYDATYSAASFVGSFVVSASIMSAVHYDTFRSLGNIWDMILYPSGVLVLMVGVYVLVRGSRAQGELVLGEADDEDIVLRRKDSDGSQVPFMYTQVDEYSQDEKREIV